MKTDPTRLEAYFGISFKNRTLLEQALTHKSYAYENHSESNQRLEFLGDAVIGLAVARFMYDHLPAAEGVLTKRRAQIVCESSLARFAHAAGLGEHLLLGRGEEKANGRERQSNLADAFEAFVGAVYLDKGMKEVHKVLKKALYPAILEGDLDVVTDYKSTLQELMQAQKRTLEYVVESDDGPSNAKQFKVLVRLIDDNIILGHGIGSSKKLAEQDAARDALEIRASTEEEPGDD